MGEVERLAHLFANAAIDPKGWMPALAALAGATRSGHGELVMIGARGSRIADQSWMTDDDVLDHAAFIAAGGYDPAANPRIAASVHAAPLRVIHEAHYDAVEPLLVDDGVRNVFRDARIESGCQTALIRDDRLLVGLAVLRGGRDGRTAEADRTLFAAVAPFVRDAAQIHLATERQGAALLAGAFEAMAAAAFLLDASGRVMARTATAEALLRGGRLRLDEGRLAAAGPRDATALTRAIGPRLALTAGLPLPLATVPLWSAGGEAPLMVDVSSLPAGEWAFGVAPRVLVVVRGGAMRRQRALGLVRQTWDLSAAEADVALRLAHGQSRAMIAAARGVSPETVRAQLKAIFAKLGVKREAEAAARAAALVAGLG